MDVYQNSMNEADQGKTNDISCPFCTLSEARIVKSNDHALSIRDGFPISEGHTLIIPKRHIGKIGAVFLKTLWKTHTALSTTSKQSSLANVRNVPHETFHR